MIDRSVERLVRITAAGFCVGGLLSAATKMHQAAIALMLAMLSLQVALMLVSRKPTTPPKQHVLRCVYDGCSRFYAGAPGEAIESVRERATRDLGFWFDGDDEPFCVDHKERAV